MKKFKIAFFGGDSHAGTINDMFQDSLPYHPNVERVDFQWTSFRLGKYVLDNVDRFAILEKVKQGEYDLIFQNVYEIDAGCPGWLETIDKYNLWDKVVLYDIADDGSWHYEQYRKKCLLYLKRAWETHLYPKAPLDNVIPLDFPLFRWYLEVVPMNYYPLRDMAVTCTLPQLRDRSLARGLVVHTVRETDWEPVEGWIQQLTLFYSSGWTLSSAATSYREPIDPPAPAINWWYVYMHMLRRTKILFGAANHSACGDHRTWESFGSGALVITSDIRVPNPNNPVPGEHYIKFDLDDPQKTIKIAKELLKDHTERERIAKAGLEHAIKYHSSDARVDYVIQEILKRKGE